MRRFTGGAETGSSGISLAVRLDGLYDTSLLSHVYPEAVIMADVTPKQARLERVTIARTEADRLLAIATHDTMKTHIVLALRDLDECVLCLGQERADSRPTILTLVDRLIDVAELRLGMVDQALADYGPGANVIG